MDSNYPLRYMPVFSQIVTYLIMYAPIVDKQWCNYMIYTLQNFQLSTEAFEALNRCWRCCIKSQVPVIAGRLGTYSWDLRTGIPILAAYLPAFYPSLDYLDSLHFVKKWFLKMLI